MAYTPPRSRNATLLALKLGVKLMLNPPYAYSNVGLVPSNSSPFWCTTNMGTWVPSLEENQICLASNWEGSKATSGWLHNVDVPDAMSNL